MSRKIKFRCWDKREHRFTDTATLFASLDNDGTLNDEYYIEVDEFTGLYDSDGVEIYENDVLSPIAESAGQFVVKFDKGSFIVVNKFGIWGPLSKYFEVCQHFGHGLKVVGKFRVKEGKQ